MACEAWLGMSHEAQKKLWELGHFFRAFLRNNWWPAQRRRLIEGTLEDSEVTQLACVAMAGAAAEAMQYSEVTTCCGTHSRLLTNV